MTTDQAQALVERQARAWEQADSAAIVADFAPDAVFIAPGVRWQGHDAIRSAAAAFFAFATDVEVVVTRVLVDGDQTAVEWTWSETRRADGHRHSVDDAIIFTLHGDKIQYWREYFDTAGGS